MRSGFLLCLAFALALAVGGAAEAGTLPCTAPPESVPPATPDPDVPPGPPHWAPTPQSCGWAIGFGGEVVAKGKFLIDDSGNVSLEGPASAAGPLDPNGNPTWTAFVDPDNFGGNVDPELVFGLGATNNTNAVATFAFVFNLPLGGFPTPIQADSALGTTLTAPSDANATVFPTLGVGKIVDAQDLRFDPFESVDKGVDIGDALTDPAGGLSTLRNELAFGSINSGGPFDLVTVVVAFGLTDDSLTAGSGVGFSGRVTQIPEPGTIGLLGAGLLGLAWLRRQET